MKPVLHTRRADRGTPPWEGGRPYQRLDSIWVTTCCAPGCGEIIEIHPSFTKPKRDKRTSPRCINHPLAGVACARFVRAAAVAEKVQGIGR